MNALLRASTAAFAVCAISAFSQPAFADCNAVRDACLIGTWKMTVNGAEQWMRENIHEARVNGIAATNNTITFRTDGSYVTGASHISAHVSAEHELAEGTGTMNAQASGRWSAGGGVLNLCPVNVTSSGTTEYHNIENGTTATVPLPPITPRESRQSYTCSGDRMTTTQPMPRGTTMTSTYTRMH